jgi:serine/threonine-protein kinase
VLTNLSHPHVVAIIDRGRHDDLFFFAMEFVEGKSLREKLSPGPLPVEEAATLVGQVLSALHHAHQRGVVHRDLKPENVLLSGMGAVKVADFGLAAMMGRTGDDRITQSSVAMGTMSYMAPEQRRDAHGVDQRADLYSAGVVLYELLTGEVPAGRFELPSKRRPGVPRAVDLVIERALAAEPADRFTNAAEMARALAQGASAGNGWLGVFSRLFGGR